MAKTQKNKATSFHLGQLKAKLSKLKKELLTPTSSGGGGGAGFDVARTGVASVGFIGFPSVGKSTLMSRLTGQHSEAAAYEFTTLTTVPGQIIYNGAKIQILDLPGIIQGAKDGKGRVTRWSERGGRMAGMREAIEGARRQAERTSDLASAAHGARERYEDYREKGSGSAVTSFGRLRQLEQERDLAETLTSAHRAQVEAVPHDVGLAAHDDVEGVAHVALAEDVRAGRHRGPVQVLGQVLHRVQRQRAQHADVP